MSVSNQYPKIFNWKSIDQTSEEVLKNYLTDKEVNLRVTIGYGALFKYAKEQAKTLDLTNKLIRALPAEKLPLLREVFSKDEQNTLFPKLIDRSLSNYDQNHLIRVVDLVNSISSNQFMLCCKLDYREVVKKIVGKKYASPNQFDATNTYTALHLACRQNNVNTARELISLGANVNVVTNDAHKSAPLHAAAADGLKDMSELLLNEHADVNQQDNYRFTPAHWACVKGYVDLTIMFAQHGADLSMTQQDGETTVTLALKTANDAWKNALMYVFKDFYFICNIISESPFTEILSTIKANPGEFIHQDQYDIGANPLEVPLLLNDPEMMGFMKRELPPAKFADLSQKIKEKYPITAEKMITEL